MAITYNDLGFIERNSLNKLLSRLKDYKYWKVDYNPDSSSNFYYIQSEEKNLTITRCEDDPDLFELNIQYDDIKLRISSIELYEDLSEIYYNAEDLYHRKKRYSDIFDYFTKIVGE